MMLKKSKGKIVTVMKKWWLVVLVATLAPFLISCSKKKKELLQSNFGFTQCDGTIGSFDAYVIKSRTSPGMYELVLVPVQVDGPGDIASITVANNTKAYKQMVSQVVLNDQQEIFGGYLSENDLYNYDILAITPYDPTTNFSEQVPAKDAFCTLPLPGDVQQ